MLDSALISEIENFLKSTNRNQWVYGDFSRAYIRKSKRFVGGEIKDFFDVASIEVDKSHQKKGAFKNLMIHLITSGKHNILVESAHNPVVEKVVRGLGFIEHEFDKESKNFYFINSIK